MDKESNGEIGFYDILLGYNKGNIRLRYTHVIVLY